MSKNQFFVKFPKLSIQTYFQQRLVADPNSRFIGNRGNNGTGIGIGTVVVIIIVLVAIFLLVKKCSKRSSRFVYISAVCLQFVLIFFIFFF